MRCAFKDEIDKINWPLLKNGADKFGQTRIDIG
jgi:hypothetical protein